jgi:hypothetical protein
MPAPNLLTEWETPETLEDLAPDLRLASGYAVASDVSAGALVCATSTSYQRYKGREWCEPFSPCY